MEQTNNVNSVLISSQRIEIENNGMEVGHGNRVFNWNTYEAIALNLQKDDANYMAMEEMSFLKSYKKHSIYVADKYLPTVEESMLFVQKMLKDSNFAKADKILFVLYHKSLHYPFGVVVEDF